MSWSEVGIEFFSRSGLVATQKRAPEGALLARKYQAQFLHEPGKYFFGVPPDVAGPQRKAATCVGMLLTPSAVPDAVEGISMMLVAEAPLSSEGKLAVFTKMPPLESVVTDATYLVGA